MNVREKVGLLGLRSGNISHEHRGANAASARHDAAAGSGPPTKADRNAAALQLWNTWATDAMGPMSADPTPEELARKSRRVQRLEQECAAMAARAQRRLEMSAAIRSAPVHMTTGVPGADGVASLALRPGTFNREMQFAVREARKAAAYAAARTEGEAEANAASACADADAASALIPPAFKSRTMLDALLASRGRAQGNAVGFTNAAADSGIATIMAAAMQASLPVANSPTGGTAQRLRPQSARVLRSTDSGASGRSRPRSAMPGNPSAPTPNRSTSPAPAPSAFAGASISRMPSMAARAANLAASMPFPAGMVSVPEGEYMALRAEVESVGERLAAAQAALEVQSATEGQLREALDLLRGRLHSAGLREVDAQRRLAQHSKLEPVFDRLAEAFTFSSPEEVVARLEFLEDDKLGTFDQLLRTQEEVTRLQQRLIEAQKANETVATRLTTEHLQGSARLQEQNEELRQELESMENLVQKLTARQAQLVALQTAVLQLWGKLTDDPQFAEAFGAAGGTGPGGATSSGASAAGGSPTRRNRTNVGNTSLHGGTDDSASVCMPSDPLAMLHMIEEFVTAKSSKLAIRHFIDIQRVANHVWQQHFRTRADIRGRVVPTFEQLSKMADRMAGRLNSVQDQAGRSQEAEKQLMRQVKRLQQQKRQLEVALARRDEQFKSVMGVPRRDRPNSATAEVGRILRQEGAAAAAAASSPSGGGGGTSPVQRPPTSRAVSAMSLSGAMSPSGLRLSKSSDQPEVSISIASGLGNTTVGQLQVQSSTPPASARKTRPASAPSGQAGVAANTSYSRVRQALYGAMTATGATPAGNTLASILSPAVTSQVPQMVADLPNGAHWRQYANVQKAAAAQRGAPSRLPAGSLFYAATGNAGGGSSGVSGVSGGVSGAEGTAVFEAPYSDPAVEGGEGEIGNAVPSLRWAAPQRSAIEHAFLSRLERRTRVT